ncbi:hypothetical protein ACFRMN_14520 [Streptomyces sp. NPDC056835]|uniref:hypothetical protein n=1 Tax=Streptomyces sp. NPDC056835 TaxID=3345956 RepID=UPI0036A7C2B6
MTAPEALERITAPRAELDGLEEQLVKQLSEVRAERDELAVAVRVWQRMSEQLADEQAAAGSPVVRVAGRAVRLVPDRAPGVDEAALPVDYQRIVAAVRQAAGPIATRSLSIAATQAAQIWRVHRVGSVISGWSGTSPPRPEPAVDHRPPGPGSPPAARHISGRSGAVLQSTHAS